MNNFQDEHKTRVRNVLTAVEAGGIKNPLAKKLNEAINHDNVTEVISNRLSAIKNYTDILVGAVIPVTDDKFKFASVMSLHTRANYLSPDPVSVSGAFDILNSTNLVKDIVNALNEGTDPAELVDQLEDRVISSKQVIIDLEELCARLDVAHAIITNVISNLIASTSPAFPEGLQTKIHSSSLTNITSEIAQCFRDMLTVPDGHNHTSPNDE